MKIRQILTKKHRWFLSFLTFSLAGTVVLAACSQAAQANAATNEKGDTANYPKATAEELKLTNALLAKQSFKQYLSSFPVSLEEAFQIPSNTLENKELLPSVSGQDFKYVFQEFFEKNKLVVGSSTSSSNDASGMYQTIGNKTDDHTKQSIYGYLAALLQNESKPENGLQSLVDKIKGRIVSLVTDLNQLQTKIATATKPSGTPETPNYLVQQAAVLTAAQNLVATTNDSNLSVLKTSVKALNSSVTAVLSDLEKVTGSINQLKTDFNDLSKKFKETNLSETTSQNSALNDLLNKFSQLFITQKSGATSGNTTTLPFDSNASLFETNEAVKLLANLDSQVDFASFYTKVRANDSRTINLLASHYQDRVSEDVANLKKDKAKNLLVVLTKNEDSGFLKNLKTLKTTLASYKVLLGDQTNSESINHALNEAQNALKNETTTVNNKTDAESALTNLVSYLAEFKTKFINLQNALDAFVVLLEQLEIQAKTIMEAIDTAENFGDLLNIVSLSIVLKNAILEINKLVPLPNEDNATTAAISSSTNLGQKFEALRGEDILRKLENQSEQLLKFIKKMPSDTHQTLKAALEKVVNETEVDTVKNKTGVLDQLLYGALDWNKSGTMTYGINGYQGQKSENHSSNATNLKDFLNNFGTSNQKGLTVLGQVQKLINENYVLEANPQSLAILNQIIEVVK